MAKMGCVFKVLALAVLLHCLAAFDVAPPLAVGAMKTSVAFGSPTSMAHSNASSSASSLFVRGGRGGIKNFDGVVPREASSGTAVVLPVNPIARREVNKANAIQPTKVKTALPIAANSAASFMEAFAVDPVSMGPGQNMTWTGVLGPKGLFLLARHIPEAFRRLVDIFYTPKWIEVFRRDVPLLKSAILNYVKLAEIVDGLKQRLKPTFTIPFRKKATRIFYPFRQAAKTKAFRMCKFLWKKVVGRLPKNYKEGEENHGAFLEGCGIKGADEVENPDDAFASLIAKFEATPVLSYWSWLRALKRSPIMTPIRAVKVFIGDTLRGFPGVTSDYLIGSGTLVSSRSCLSVAKSFNDVLPLNYAFSGGILSKGLYMTFRGFQLSFWQYLPLFRGVFSIMLGLLCYIGVPKLLVQIFGIAGRIWRITKRAMQSGRIRYFGLAFDLLGRRLMEKVVSKYGGLLLVYLFQLTSIDMQEHMNGKTQDPGQERAFFAQADGLYMGFFDFAEKVKELKDEYEYNYDRIVDYCQQMRAGPDSVQMGGGGPSNAGEGANQFMNYQGRTMLPGEFGDDETFRQTRDKANQWFMCRGYTAAKKERSVRNFLAQLRKWLKIELQYVLEYLVRQMSFLYDAFHVEATLNADEKVQASMKSAPHMAYDNFARLQKEMWSAIPRHTSANDMTARMYRHPFLKKGIRTFTHLVIESSTEWVHRGVTDKKVAKFAKKVGKVYQGLFGEVMKAAQVYQTLDTGKMRPFDGKKEGLKIVYTLASGLQIPKDGIFSDEEREDQNSLDNALNERHIFADIQEYVVPSEERAAGPSSPVAHSSHEDGSERVPRKFKAVDLHGRNVVFQVEGSKDCINAPSRQMIKGSNVQFLSPRTRRLELQQGTCQTRGLLVFMDGKDSLVRATRDPEAVYAAIFTSLSDDSQGRNRLVANATTRVVMAACQEVVDQGRTWSYAVKTLMPAQFWKVVVSDEATFDDRVPQYLKSPQWLTFRNIRDSFLQALDGVVEALPFTGVQSRKMDLVSVFLVGFVYYMLQKFETVTQGDQYILEALQRTMAKRLEAGGTGADDAFMEDALHDFLAIGNVKAPGDRDRAQSFDAASTVASEADLDLREDRHESSRKGTRRSMSEGDFTGDGGYCTREWPEAVLQAMKAAKPQGMSWTRFFNVNKWMFAEHSRYEMTEDATNIAKQFASRIKQVPGFLLMKAKRVAGKGFAKGNSLFGWLKRKVFTRGPDSVKQYPVCNRHCLMGILKSAKDRAPVVNRRCYVDLKGLILYGGLMRGTAKATAVLSKGLHMQLVLRQMRLETRRSKDSEEILAKFRELAISMSPDMRTSFLGFLRSLDGAANMSFGLPEKLAAIFNQLEEPRAAVTRDGTASATPVLDAQEIDPFDDLRDFGDKGLGYLTDVLDLFRKTGSILGLTPQTRFHGVEHSAVDSGASEYFGRSLLRDVYVGQTRAEQSSSSPTSPLSPGHSVSTGDDARIRRSSDQGSLFDANEEPDGREQYYPIAPQFRFNLQCMDELELSLSLRLGPHETIESRLLSWRLAKVRGEERLAGDSRKSGLVAMEDVYTKIEKEKEADANILDLSWATAMEILEDLNSRLPNTSEIPRHTIERITTFLGRVQAVPTSQGPVRRLAFVNPKHKVLVLRHSQALASQPIEEPRSRLFDYLFSLGEIVKKQDTIQCGNPFLEYPDFMLESFAFESSERREYQHRLGPVYRMLGLLWGAKSNSSLPAKKIVVSILNYEPEAQEAEEWKKHEGRRAAFFRTFLAVLDEAKINTREATLRNKSDFDLDIAGWSKDHRKIRDWKFKAAWEYIFNNDSLAAVSRFHEPEELESLEEALNRAMLSLTRRLYDEAGDLAPRLATDLDKLHQQDDLVLLNTECEEKVVATIGRLIENPLRDEDAWKSLWKPHSCEPAWHSKMYRLALLLSDIKESGARRAFRKVRNVARLVRKPFLVARLRGLLSKRKAKAWFDRKRGENADERDVGPQLSPTLSTDQDPQPSTSSGLPTS